MSDFIMWYALMSCIAVVMFLPFVIKQGGFEWSFDDLLFCFIGIVFLALTWPIIVYSLISEYIYERLSSRKL